MEDHTYSRSPIKKQPLQNLEVRDQENVDPTLSADLHPDLLALIEESCEVRGLSVAANTAKNVSYSKCRY